MRGKSFLAVFLLLILSAPFSLAQFDSSAVLGIVHDTSDAPIAGSKVNLINLATGVSLETTTDGQGNFQFPDVHIGHFKISASAPGFSDSVTDPFAVNVNTRQR